METNDAGFAFKVNHAACFAHWLDGDFWKSFFALQYLYAVPLMCIHKNAALQGDILGLLRNNRFA